MFWKFPRMCVLNTQAYSWEIMPLCPLETSAWVDLNAIKSVTEFSRAVAFERLAVFAMLGGLSY